MLIGIDFDNTLVSYDALFFRIAREQNLVTPDFPQNKVLIRDHLRACGRESEWTAMQGLAYGPRMAEAEPFRGARAALENLSSADRNGISTKPRDRGWIRVDFGHRKQGFERRTSFLKPPRKPNGRGLPRKGATSLSMICPKF